MKRLVAGAVLAAALAAASSIPASLTVATTHAARATQAARQAATPEQIVASAKSYLGSPYAIIGDSPATGFSCIGFVHFIFTQNGVDVPYDTPMAWNSAPHVSLSDLMPGDILFFSNTVFAGLSHVAIYIGGGKMIGADNFQVGVTVDNLYDSYWMNHYTGATRPLALLGTAPQPGTTQQDTTPVATATATPVPTEAPATVPASAAAGTQLQPLTAAQAVYSGPGYGYTPIARLSAQAVLTVVQGQNGWYDVRFHDAQLGDTFGWVAASSVRPATRQQPSAPAFSAPAATPAPQPKHQFARAAAVTAGTPLVVAQGPLYVRRGPGKQFSAIGYVRKGARLTGLSQSGDWMRVSTSSGLIGWVAAQYLEKAPVTQYSQASSGGHSSTQGGTATAHVTATVLNVRSAPQNNAQVLTVLFAGETVRVLGQAHGWLEVQLRSGTVGWASGKWLALGGN